MAELTELEEQVLVAGGLLCADDGGRLKLPDDGRNVRYMFLVSVPSESES